VGFLVNHFPEVSDFQKPVSAGLPETPPLQSFYNTPLSRRPLLEMAVFPRELSLWTSETPASRTPETPFQKDFQISGDTVFARS
jgi:hypothetical protein